MSGDIDSLTVNEAAADVMLDARGYRCPAPILRMERALRLMADGERLLLLADDPIAGIDIPHFIGDSRHELLSTRRNGDGFSFLIRKQAAD